MTKSISIQLKAGFLLLVFTLNTIVGFACSMGMDMGFNTPHHKDNGKEASVHIHPDGTKHQHHHDEADEVTINTTESAKGHHHHDEAESEIPSHHNANVQKGHHHDEAEEVSANGTENDKNHHDESEEQLQDKKDTTESDSDDCCHDKVVKISQTDKAISNSNVLIHPVFFTAFVCTYGLAYVSYSSQITKSIKYFVRGHHPPIPDIRIAIQSFQI